jgi:sugar phosphate isomerase/epimerase
VEGVSRAARLSYKRATIHMPGSNVQLAVSSRSFHNALTRRRMVLEDVPAVAQELGYKAIEIDDIYLQARSRLVQFAGALFMRRYFGRGVTFREYTSARLLKLHAAIEEAGMRLVAWTAHTDFTLTDKAAQWQMHYLEGAIATATDFGVRIVCIQAGGSDQPTQDEMVHCIEGLRAAARLADRFRTRLALESGSGITRSAERMAKLLREIDSPYLGACLRIGTEECVALAPLAIHVHATAKAFDAQGRVAETDYAAHMAALQAANYTGWISVRYEGAGEPTQGIMQIAELVSALAT